MKNSSGIRDSSEIARQVLPLFGLKKFWNDILQTLTIHAIVTKGRGDMEKIEANCQIVDSHTYRSIAGA